MRGRFSPAPSLAWSRRWDRGRPLGTALRSSQLDPWTKANWASPEAGRGSTQRLLYRAAGQDRRSKGRSLRYITCVGGPRRDTEARGSHATTTPALVYLQHTGVRATGRRGSRSSACQSPHPLPPWRRRTGRRSGFLRHTLGKTPGGRSCVWYRPWLPGRPLGSFGVASIWEWTEAEAGPGASEPPDSGGRQLWRMKKTARDRGQTRTKAEKVRPPTVPVPQVEIVPGRLNEAEWIALVSIEEGEDVVGDILAELLARVMDAAFKIYLTQQVHIYLLPPTHPRARIIIVDIFFLSKVFSTYVMCHLILTTIPGSMLVTDVDIPTLEMRLRLNDLPLSHISHLGGVLLQLFYIYASHSPSARPERPCCRSLSGDSLQGMRGTECSEQLPLHQKTWISCSEEQSLSFWEPLELGPTPGPPPTPELSSQSPQHFVLPHPCLDSAPNSYPCLSMWESSQISLETSSPMSPHPSLDMYLWGSSQAPLTSQPTYVRSPQPTPRSSFHPQGGGDTQDQMEEADLPSPYYLSVPLPPFLASPPWGLPKSRPLPAQVPSLSPTLLPAASAKFMRLQLGRSYLAPGLVYDKMGQIIAMDPLDPTHLPQHQIQPLAKVVVPDAEVHPLESYKEQRKHVKYGKKLNFKLPAHRRPIPNFHRGFHFPSPGLPFLTPVLELQSRHFTPKQWSNIQWPSGLERKTDLLQMQPVGSSLMSTMESGKRPSPDLSTLPHHGTRVLEATSQLMWKPSSLLDTMKLMPNVSLWNPSKNTHRSGFIPSHREREKTLGPLSEEPSEQRPIQTHALNPQVTVAQLLKGSPPKVRALPSQEALNTTFPEEA